MEANPLLDALTDLIGADHVLTDEDSLNYFSGDLFFDGSIPTAVIAPGTLEHLAQSIKVCTGSGHAVVPRGGGLSYTGGYILDDKQIEFVVLDTRRLDRIVELNPNNLTITVECGCTWEKVMEASSKHHLRVPMFGPSTGRYSTIGGSLSNNCMFFGSAKTGTSADVVLGLDVITADGATITTGSGAIEQGQPFFRNHGPDMTGLFLNDAGALGVKATATLKLEPIPAGVSFATFSFERFNDLIEAIQLVGKTGLASECLGAGPVNGEKGPSLHIVTEGWTQDIADASLAVLRDLVGSSGVNQDAVVPSFIRTNPFSFVDSPIDAQGRLQIWTHGVFPYDRTQTAFDAFKRVLDDHAEDMRLVDMEATMSFACAGNAMMVEPVLYWTGNPTALHLTGMADKRDSASPDGSEDADLLARRIREAFNECMVSLGAAHMQYGRFYPYASVTNDRTVILIAGIKRILDPKKLLNPGVLEA